MPYQTLATSQTPALIIYLLDVSASMSMPLADKRRTDVVTDALAAALRQMVFRSTKGRRIFPRYRMAIYAYSEKVFDVLGGIKTVAEVARLGVPELAPMATTDTAKGLRYVEKLLQAELGNLQSMPAPVVCHMTDGIFTGEDPEPISQRIMQMQVPDGHVLMTNIFISDELPEGSGLDSRRWPGITDQTALSPEKYLSKLRRMSSKIPESYRTMMAESGYQLQPGAYMLLPGANPELVAMGFQIASATPVQTR
ncbi:MAG: VWA domain-containing protein [Chloroflexi bacterium]|nr:VWA domain-containing protein [Chloroflexota bacterium]MCI0645800.1 VWA domain-containing protein [Chloroflexota bacterium]MCI0727269.1 VWA domain-containing protein [Chloroflexota bacterium]